MTPVHSEKFVLMAWNSFQGCAASCKSSSVLSTISLCFLLNFLQNSASSQFSSGVLFCASAHVLSHSFLCYISSILSACFAFHIFQYMNPHISSHETTSIPHSFHSVLFISDEWCYVFPSPAAAVGHCRAKSSCSAPTQVLIEGQEQRDIMISLLSRING